MPLANGVKSNISSSSFVVLGTNPKSQNNILTLSQHGPLIAKGHVKRTDMEPESLGVSLAVQSTDM